MRIFPVDPKTKQPLVAGGLYAARPEEDWKGDESAAWAAPCGLANGFIVLDVDVKGVDGRLSLEGKQLPATYTVRTQSGGLHYYYKTPPVALRNRVGLLPGVDLRTDGGYVVVPPSPGYTVVEELPLANAPQWLLDEQAKPQATAPLQVGEVGEGGRNHYITQVAGKLQRSNLLTLDALQAINERDCSPPLPENEVQSIYNSVLRYSPQAPVELGESPLVWAQSLSKDMLAYLSDKDLVKGEPTGVESFDAMLGGGKRLGEVTVTLAEAKTGKNTLWHKFMYLWLQKGISLGYASRELSPETEVLPNLLSLHFKTNYWLQDSYDEAATNEALSKWRLAFSPGYGSIPAAELFSWMDACRDAGIQYIWIDHLHYCMEDPEDFKSISKLIRDVKAYAKRHGVHIDLIVQPKIQELGQRLSLNSLRGGASIGQALDNLITMTRERDQSGKLTNVVRVQLEVARSKLARLGHIFLEYNRDTCDFVEVEPDTTPEAEEPSVDTPVMDNILKSKRLS